MKKVESLRVQIKAVEAFANWKAFFADQVAIKAKELAKNSDQPSLATLEHYRQAALVAISELAVEVQTSGSCHDHSQAA